MRRFIAFITLSILATTVVAQPFTQAGVYDKSGKIIATELQPSVIGVELSVVVERFEPGVYARYAQKYLGQRAMLSERCSVQILSGVLSQGRVSAQPAQEPTVKSEAPLPINRFSSSAQTTEEQAAATAELIFSLRKHRLDLITGESGENVFGAGLRAALDEIEKMERTYLEMFYGKSVSEHTTHRFNITILAEQSEYMVCRVNESVGVVAADDLSGAPVVLRLKTEPSKIELKPVGAKDKVSAEYIVVPATECELIAENRLLDSARYVLALFAKREVAQPLK